jgi:hypothetical protein
LVATNDSSTRGKGRDGYTKGAMKGFSMSIVSRMKVVWLVLLFAGNALPAENVAESEARLRQTVTYLASDELEGRGVSTAGIDKAAEYIAGQFSKLGLRTDLFNGTPFQEFEITTSSERGPAGQNRLVIVAPENGGTPKGVELKLDEAFTPLAAGGTGKFDAPIVFAGYGITAKGLKRGGEAFTYDDFAGIDVKGKVVIIIRKEPQQTDEKSPFDGTQTTQHALFTRKMSNAAEHGAAAVIFVNDGLELVKRHEENRKLLKAALDKLAELREQLAAAQPTDAAFENLAGKVAKAATEAVELSKTLAAKADSLLAFTGAGETSTHRKLPVFFCTRAAVNQLLDAAVGKNLEALEKEIDNGPTSRSVELTGWRATGEANVIERKAKIKNVVASLEGEGPLAQETIVVGAHYDHLGRGGAGSLAPWTTEIHNGADDNASGTVTMLEIAHRLAQGPKPRRRIVFIAFTGEERGLLGSAYYTRQPRFPLESTVAMLNLDMVGRLNEEKLIVYGTGTAREFDPLVDRLCEEGGFKLTKHAGGFGPSDHSSFYSKKIPVLHLFTGTHRDYHRPSDDADKLNITGMRRIADLVVEAARAIDAADQRPTYVEIRKVERIVDDPGGERPSFGSMPAYPNPVEDGVLLEAVLEGSPAEKAGIKGGDVLIQLGDSKITVLEDFESALRKHMPGDKVKVKVRRGKEIIETEVTLGRRRG